MNFLNKPMIIAKGAKGRTTSSSYPFYWSGSSFCVKILSISTSMTIKCCLVRCHTNTT